MTDQFIAEISQSQPVVDQLTSRLPTELLQMKIVDPLFDPSWDRLVTSHPRHTLFHRSAWLSVISKTYGHKPLALQCSLNGKPKALVPLLELTSPFSGRRGISLPFTDYCDPLLFDDSDTRSVLDKLRALARERRWDYFEIRGRRPVGLPTCASVAFHGHSLDLRRGAECLFARLRGSARRAIRKAHRSGLNARLSTSHQAIRDYYRLHLQTRRRHGLPPQPFSLFKNIHEQVIAPGFGFVVLAEDRLRPVAAAVFLHTGKSAVLKFGASDYKYQHLRGNSLVMWHAITHLSQSGFETLHLGRTSQQNTGLRRFKLAWGTEEETIEHSRFDTRTNDWTSAHDNTYGLHNALFSRLPTALNRLAGALIYPHLD